MPRTPTRYGGALKVAGATVIEPLSGLTIGQRLAWHSHRPLPRNDTAPPNVTALIEQLTDNSRASTPEQFLATDGTGLRAPGLYSWWVDRSGAGDLIHGLGHPVGPGLIYARLAGATRPRSRRKSSNTL